jgi:hypothetical protein
LLAIDFREIATTVDVWTTFVTKPQSRKICQIATSCPHSHWRFFKPLAAHSTQKLSVLLIFWFFSIVLESILSSIKVHGSPQSGDLLYHHHNTSFSWSLILKKRQQWEKMNLYRS